MRSNKASSNHSRAERGTVLMIVLWICLGLVSVALVFGYSMQMSYRGVDNELSGKQAEQAIEGAMRYAIQLLNTPANPGKLPLEGSWTPEAFRIGASTAWFIGRSEDAELVSDGKLVFNIVDEGSKINLNTVTLSTLLQVFPEAPPEFLASIIDWRDTNDRPTSDPKLLGTLAGAESATYALRDPAQLCKNASFETVEELALVYGATDSLLYGEDVNHNGILDPNENDGDDSPPRDNADGKLDRGILDYVTVYSREPNLRSDGTKRLNIRSRPPAMKDLFKTLFGEQRAGVIWNLAGRASVASVLEFCMDCQMKPDEIDRVYYELGTSDGDYVPGFQVNVNTASVKTLTWMGHFTPETGKANATKVVNARKNRPKDSTGIAWIIEALGEVEARRAGPSITGRSWQFSLDIAAVGSHGRGYRRTRYVLDLSQSAPKVVYRQDLSPLGWALGARIRDELVLEGRGS